MSMVIGVTGGVGTGKSTILNILREDYGAEIIIADDVARELMMPGHQVYDAISEQFGEDILTAGPGSEIDRGKLASLVFQDEEKRLLLNSLVHPAVKQTIMSMIDSFRSANQKLIVVETAILIEAGYLPLVDELWAVCTDYELRVARLMESRGYSREKTDSIIRSQMPEEELRAVADLVIDNSGDLAQTQKQIREHFIHAGYYHK